jgi:(p)ppGpp synthase/HD superfamily hydrolase
MHQIAEYGIAAHALYKDGVGSPTEMLSRESSAYAWLRRTIELLARGLEPNIARRKPMYRRCGTHNAHSMRGAHYE